MEMKVTQAQSDMRQGYCSGGAGILASALAWSVAAVTAVLVSPQKAIWVLLVGGALIHPAGILICRLMGASGSHSRDNPFASLAAASTFWLIFCLPLAYGLGLQNPAWFFAAMLMVIGGRYQVFATLFGMRLYWALGFALAAAGVALTWQHASAALVVSAGAAIEWVFAVVCLIQHRNRAAADPSSNSTQQRGAV